MRSEREIEAAAIAAAQEYLGYPPDIRPNEIVLGIWRQVMRRALVAADAEAWRPIEEAPRDGTRLWLWPHLNSDTLAQKGYWSDAHRCWYMVHVGHLHSMWQPTHFQYLPDSPK